MDIVEKVLKILNHNGASRRYSKIDAQLIVKMLAPIAANFVEKKLNKLKTNKNDKRHNI